MKNNVSSLKSATFCLVALFSISSCDLDIFPFGSNSQYVSFTVSESSGYITKGQDESYIGSYDLAIEDLNLTMTITESVNTDLFGDISTKSVENKLSTLENNGFDVNMISGGQTTRGWVVQASRTYWQFINHAPTGNKGTGYPESDRIKWPSDDAECKFWASYGLSNPLTSNTHSYTNGEDMTDILVAYSEVQHNHNSNNCDVDIHFYHPMAKLVFNVASGISLRKIIVNNVNSKGTFTYNTEGKVWSSMISWSNLSSQIDYSIEGGNYTFFLIPQSLNDVMFTFLLTVNGKDYETAFSTNSLGTTEWKAGMSYSYTLSSAKEGDVSIDTAPIGNVIVENTNYTSVYVRAAVVGNWVEDGIIVSPWTVSSGDINLTTNGIGWIYNETDDFFYYTEPILGYDTAEKDLISTITKGTGIQNAELQVSVALQAVPYDAEKSCVSKAWINCDVTKLHTL